jgi:hypothetical protein
MKFHFIICLAAVITLPQLAPAAPSVPPNALGHVEGIVNFCVRVDPKSADKYKEIGKRVVDGMSQKELAEARSSTEYKESYEAITGELTKLPAEKAVEGCRAGLKEMNR